MTEKKVWFITGAGRGMGVGIAKAAVAAGHEGHIRAGGVDKDVTFVFVDADITKRSTPPTEPSTTAMTTATSRP